MALVKGRKKTVLIEKNNLDGNLLPPCFSIKLALIRAAIAEKSESKPKRKKKRAEIKKDNILSRLRKLAISSLYRIRDELKPLSRYP